MVAVFYSLSFKTATRRPLSNRYLVLRYIIGLDTFQNGCQVCVFFSNKKKCKKRVMAFDSANRINAEPPGVATRAAARCTARGGGFEDRGASRHVAHLCRARRRCAVSSSRGVRRCAARAGAHRPPAPVSAQRGARPVESGAPRATALLRAEAMQKMHAMELAETMGLAVRGERITRSGSAAPAARGSQGDSAPNEEDIANMTKRIGAQRQLVRGGRALAEGKGDCTHGRGGAGWSGIAGTRS